MRNQTGWLLCVAVLLVAVPSLGADEFRVVGPRIIGPDSTPFLIQGVNIHGMKYGWDGDVGKHVDLIVKHWRFNCVRINCRLTDKMWQGQNVSRNSAYQTLEQLDRLITAFTDRKVVAIIEWHDRTGKYYEGDLLEDLKTAHRALCDRYGQNPYVWFNVMNEPGGNKLNEQRWKKVHQSIIRLVRDEKRCNNIIVCDGEHWGQDAGDWGTGAVKNENSALLQWGEDLVDFDGKRYPNIVFSIHVYDQWNKGTAQQATARLGDYVDRVREKQLAIIIGEWGSASTGKELYFPNAVQAVAGAAGPRQVGRIFWSWYGGDAIDLTTDGNGGGHNIKLNARGVPTNLTPMGKIIWRDTHQVHR